MKRLLAAVIFAVMAMAACTIALADGGRSLAGAADLPVGQRVTDVAGGGLSVWKLIVGKHDRLVIDWGNNDSDDVRLCFLPAATTDYTIRQTPCVADANHVKWIYYYLTPGIKDEDPWTAPYGGSWFLVVADADCMSVSDNRAYFQPPCNGYSFDYELRARVLLATSVTLRGPHIVRGRTRMSIRGAVRGVAAEKVVLQAYRRPQWKTVALLPFDKNGFTYTLRTGPPAVYRFRAIYYGDATHQKSSSGFAVRVV